MIIMTISEDDYRVVMRSLVVCYDSSFSQDMSFNVAVKALMTRHPQLCFEDASWCVEGVITSTVLRSLSQDSASPKEGAAYHA